MPVASAALLLAAVLLAAPAWRVRARVRVRANVVTLGDLLAPLPADAAPPAGLRALVLGAAPQPGMPLHWTSAQLAARLRSAGVPVQEFAIPAAVDIERQAAPVPVAAVLAAASAYLRRPLTPQEVSFLAPLTTAADPSVAVLRAQPDLAHGRVDLICRAQNDPQLLPFSVAVRVPAAELAQQARQRWLRALAPRAAQVHDASGRARTPLLVHAGHLARFSITDPGFALVTLVQPLQSGRAGDIIRVRSLATKAVLKVRVTGTDEVGSLPNSLATLPQEADHGGS